MVSTQIKASQNGLRRKFTDSWAFWNACFLQRVCFRQQPTCNPWFYYVWAFSTMFQGHHHNKPHTMTTAGGFCFFPAVERVSSWPGKFAGNERNSDLTSVALKVMGLCVESGWTRNNCSALLFHLVWQDLKASAGEFNCMLHAILIIYSISKTYKFRDRFPIFESSSE